MPRQASSHFLFVCREPTNFQELLHSLQVQNGFQMATTGEEWASFPRMPIAIRREKVLSDALREAKKPRFNPAKLLKVGMGQAGQLLPRHHPVIFSS